MRAEIARREAERQRRDVAANAEAIRARCSTLSGFVREAWHVIEPNARYVHSWHIDAVCEHLQACSDGRITRLLINVPPGPMRYDSIVETARGPIKLCEVIVGDFVLTHKGRYREVSAVHDQGVLPILRITTNSGRVTHAAPSHPYLTPRGWIEAKDLRPGDFLGVVNRHEDRPGATDLRSEEARLLGYLVGDGSLTQATTGFTNGDREVVDDFRRCALTLGFETTETWRNSSHWQVRLLGAVRVRAWLSSHNLQGASSYVKRIPAAVMSGGSATIREFLGAYWTCDGGFDVRPTAARGSCFRAYATTVSEGLAEDLMAALGLVGIESRLRRKARPLETASQPGGLYRSFSVEIQNEAMAGRLADFGGLCSRKRAMAEKCRRRFDRALWDDEIVSSEAVESAHCLCLTVEDDHSFTCSGIAVKNSMKSLLVSVLWQAWEWGPKGMRSMRYLSTAFNDGPVTRDTRKCRDLMLSEWYRSLWPEVVLTRTAEMSFANSATGTREGVAFGSLTSQRGDRLVIDDPHSTETAESDAERQRTTRKFREGALNRLNDQERSAIVVIMQRLHEQDISGVILKLGMGYDHLCLPMEFEPERRSVTSIGFMDPRGADGDLLAPERFTRAAVDALKRDMGAHAYAGQYQQRPAPREGALFKRHWFADKIIDADRVPVGTRWVRHWDLAATARKTAARTAGVKLGRTPAGGYIVGHVVTTQSEGNAVRDIIKAQAVVDGRSVEISLPQDPGQAGKVQARDFVAMLSGWTVRAEPETGDKTTRAEPFSAQCEAGNVQIVAGPWVDLYLDELCMFPAGAFKDQVDATSGAFGRLTATKAVPIVVPYVHSVPRAMPGSY